MEEISLTVYDPNSKSYETFTVNICSSWNVPRDDSCKEKNLTAPLPSTGDKANNIPKPNKPLPSADVNSYQQDNEIKRPKRRRSESRTHDKKKKHKSKEERGIGPNCGCIKKCYERIGEKTIEKTFKDFWALSNFNSQVTYLLGQMSLFGVKKRYTKNEFSRRNYTVTYYINKNGFDLVVCKVAFLNIHGLQRRLSLVKNLLKYVKSGDPLWTTPLKRGRPKTYNDEAVEHVRRFHLQSSSLKTNNAELTSRQYYQVYVSTYCQENKLSPVSLFKFRVIISANECIPNSSE